MKKKYLLFVFVISIAAVNFHTAKAQWNLTGNSNATSASKLGTTNPVPLTLFTNNFERVIIDTGGRVGTGIAPVNILTVKASGGTPASSWLTGLNSPTFFGFANNMSSELVLAAASNAPAERSVFHGRRSRGTLTVPTVVSNNDYLTSLLASGYDGNTFQNPALASIFVDGTPLPAMCPQGSPSLPELM